MLLDNTNYTSWKAYIQQRLQEEGLLAITLGDEVKPEPNGTNGKEIEEFKKKSRLAFYLLIKSIDDSVIFSVSALNFESNPRELWEVLKTKYFPDDLSEKLEAMRNLRSIKFKNNPEEFVEQIRASFASVENAGFQFDETTWMVMFLSQLPRTITDSIINRNGQEETSTQPQRSSISTCDKLFEKLISLSITPSNCPQNLNPNEKQKNGPAASSNHYNQYSCTHCNKKGHDINHCWFVHPERNPFHKNNPEKGSGTPKFNKEIGPASNGFFKKDHGATSDGWRLTPRLKKFDNDHQFNGSNHGSNNNNLNKPQANKHFNNNQHSRTASNANNSGGGSEWSSFSKNPSRVSSGDNNDWRAPTPKQSTSNQSGWDGEEGPATPLTNGGSGWNDMGPSHTATVNETGWTENHQDF
ncbi:hypothetical protein PGT21_008631 [Puccinia graminis f. sp. tritici]|uniref:Retrotransposon Copia-like N-terminal domain-containing protein n=1 Tax=Puccinia graminis f. sp. tritici TaxID=56615 RepID=A0A5B0NIQ8_PUCGR|nr:hypothetical protein PGTUg99_030637 [Puccinia graminis f. sp. tritici]KAA1105478.1 hypothetical protein PGT21_008631 [Puccinia graminis f. sp. tritici]